MSGARKPHHAGSYPRQAVTIRAAAYANPNTRCWRCHRTLLEHRTSWQAGHTIDGLNGGPLAAECQPCNSSSGASRGNRMRGQGTTQSW